MKNKGLPNRRLIKRNTSRVARDLMTMLRERNERVGEIDMGGKQPKYTLRKDGVIREGDPRTDKWDMRQEALDIITQTKLGRRAAFDEAKNSTSEVTEGEVNTNGNK